MIEIKNKENCSGCSACYNICPKNAITMKADNEGFEYPEIDKEKCINCGLCEKVCPILKKQINENKPKAYAVYIKSDKIRKESTSGGIFTAIAEKIIDMNGVIFGAKFNDNFEVVHSYIEKKEDLNQFRGSKYVQSKILDTYRKAKEFLEQDRYVLYTGTPCQINGLKSFLKKDYEKLYCIELFCKGAPSPLVWKKYVDMKGKENIKSIYFREKTYGFKSTTMSIYYKNTKSYHNGHESDPMLGLFVKEMISRPSCYKCEFKGINRISDFSIGDFWKVGQLVNEFNIEENKGVSLVLTNNDKAEKLLKSIDKNIEKKEVDLDDALKLNGGAHKSALLSSRKPNEKRESFFKDLNSLDFKSVVKKYHPQTFKSKTKAMLKPILYKLGLLDKIK